jgi:hypothetical protein
MRTPKKEFGGWKFGDASMLDMNDLHRQKNNLLSRFEFFDLTGGRQA